jgi:hypothetical protein
MILAFVEPKLLHLTLIDAHSKGAIARGDACCLEDRLTVVAKVLVVQKAWYLLQPGTSLQLGRLLPS